MPVTQTVKEGEQVKMTMTGKFCPLLSIAGGRLTPCALFNCEWFCGEDPGIEECVIQRIAKTLR